MAGAAELAASTYVSDKAFLTDVAAKWEHHLLLRVAKALSRLVAKDLTKQEEELFELYQRYDHNLDGVVAGEEAVALAKDSEELCKAKEGEEEGVTLIDEKTGSTTFRRMLQWQESRDAALPTGFAATFASYMGESETVKCTDARLEMMDNDELRKSIVGYRMILKDVREHYRDKLIDEVLATEKEHGLFESARAFHHMVVSQLDQNEQVVFDAFLQVDVSGDLHLCRSEVQSLMHRIMPDAQKPEINGYVEEMVKMGGDDEILTFGDVLRWWHGSRENPDSVLAQKLDAMIASMQSIALNNRLDSLITGAWSGERLWKLARERGDEAMQTVRDSYLSVMSEVREYKMELEIRHIEIKSGQL
eukprot:TRINITY_DN29282_c0_g1_i1.p1 TRINITY_DN29282_c0_g1~~TRINITY_DN29282_c0_g1_i1.p1  ORF type:complete len:362 (+),score=99.51 TRINITY_DN29282_c0_g1_i1:126-1211(+)